ncbi:Neuronal cell adhesion molecule, partial [Geodia barretti]
VPYSVCVFGSQVCFFTHARPGSFSFSGEKSEEDTCSSVARYEHADVHSAMDGGLRWQPRRLLLWIVVACGYLCSELASGSTGDVFFINQTTGGCGSEDRDVPGGVSVSAVTNSSATIHWDAVVVQSGASHVLGYQVIYWSKADTRYSGVNVTGLSSEQATLQNLHPYTSYLVAVRLRCSEGRVGVASPAFSFNTEAAEPTGKVVNLSVSLVGSGEHEATISWSPLSSGDWNGVPYGYYVSIYTMRAFPKPTLKPYELCSRAKRHIFS